jgi:hypothetical protein
MLGFVGTWVWAKNGEERRTGAPIYRLRGYGDGGGGDAAWTGGLDGQRRDEVRTTTRHQSSRSDANQQPVCMRARGTRGWVCHRASAPCTGAPPIHIHAVAVRPVRLSALLPDSTPRPRARSPYTLRRTAPLPRIDWSARPSLIASSRPRGRGRKTTPLLRCKLACVRNQVRPLLQHDRGVLGLLIFIHSPGLVRRSSASSKFKI